MLFRLYLACALMWLAASDCYMHRPRGSNNRLNEASANRNNANRCFDSQNNNRGGYNVGEISTTTGFPNTDQYFNTFAEGYTQGFWTGNQDGTARYETAPGTSTTQEVNKQTESFYWEKSFMPVTWTVQHGCGANPKVLCQMIAQYAVENMVNVPTRQRNGQTAPALTSGNTVLRGGTALSAAGDARYSLMRRLGLRVMLMNGRNTNTPQDDSSTDMGTLSQRFVENSATNGRCQHEGNEWYSLCRNRDRNKGLFTADQKVNDDRATYTRQNPNGNRRGLECPEERDYYPYWYPSPFVDAAVLTDDMATCNAIVADSQNVVQKYACTEGPNGPQNGQGIPTSATVLDAFNRTQCESTTTGVWEGFSWNMPAPACLMAPHSQVNHLGNMITNDMGGQGAGGSQAYFMWQLPAYADLVAEDKILGYPHVLTASKVRNLQGVQDTSGAQITRRCVRMLFRLRYNISTLDYDPYNTNASMNDKPNEGIISPIKQNPTIEMGVLQGGLRLAINTAQTGRTFQDRSHTFLVCERPLSSGIAANEEILNLEVQGKRGNIVQTFPATEYQFSPRQFTLCKGGATTFHFQWTGSNTHNNGNPAGDGQAGDAGEGRGGSDRNNMVQMINLQTSYPLAYDKASQIGVTNFWDHVDCRHGVSLEQYSAEGASIAAGTSGYYHSREYATAFHSVFTNPTTDDRLQVLFNNAAASYRGGIVCKAKNTLPSGTQFAFMCTRNNNFSNRAQKLLILVQDTCSFAQMTDPNMVGSQNPQMMLG